MLCVDMVFIFNLSFLMSKSITQTSLLSLCCQMTEITQVRLLTLLTSVTLSCSCSEKKCEVTAMLTPHCESYSQHDDNNEFRAESL